MLALFLKCLLGNHIWKTPGFAITAQVQKTITTMLSHHNNDSSVWDVDGRGVQRKAQRKESTDWPPGDRDVIKKLRSRGSTGWHQ
jgi:hypothetical protein